jgi:hypothetical protein
VGITVTTRGPSFDRLIADTVRDLRQANRTSAREVQRTGLAAMRMGAPRMWGRKLAIKSKSKTHGVNGSNVEFFPAPNNLGGWAMREKGTKAHDIYPRRGRAGRGGRPAALKIVGLYAANAWHPGSTGEKAWTRAGERLWRAIDPVVEDVYDDALE